MIPVSTNIFFIFLIFNGSFEASNKDPNISFNSGNVSKSLFMKYSQPLSLSTQETDESQ